jgi:predicted RNA binding protein YcfA (HicA-like mRNA interferase family)
MSILPMLTARQMMRALDKAGQTGSHARLRYADGRVVTVPIHAGQDIGRGLLRKILRDADITPAELLALLD